MTAWPTHDDGRAKKMGEMTRDEARAVVAASCKRLEAEFNSPPVREKLNSILGGKRVDH